MNVRFTTGEGKRISLMNEEYTKLEPAVMGIYSCSVQRGQYTWVKYSQVYNFKGHLIP